MSDTASWYYGEHLPKLARQKEEEEERKKMEESIDRRAPGNAVRYDDHIVGQGLLPNKKKPDIWEYNSDNCTETISLDISDQDMLQLSVIAHNRDITLNHLINEVLHDKIQRDLLQHSG